MVDKQVVSLEILVRGKGKVQIAATLNTGKSINVTHALEEKLVAEAFLPHFKKYLADMGIDVTHFDSLAKAETHGVELEEQEEVTMGASTQQ